MKPEIKRCSLCGLAMKNGECLSPECLSAFSRGVSMAAAEIKGACASLSLVRRVGVEFDADSPTHPDVAQFECKEDWTDEVGDNPRYIGHCLVCGGDHEVILLALKTGRYEEERMTTCPVCGNRELKLRLEEPELVAEEASFVVAVEN